MSPNLIRPTQPGITEKIRTTPPSRATLSPIRRTFADTYDDCAQPRSQPALCLVATRSTRGKNGATKCSDSETDTEPYDRFDPCNAISPNSLARKPRSSLPKLSSTQICRLRAPCQSQPPRVARWCVGGQLARSHAAQPHGIVTIKLTNRPTAVALRASVPG